MSWRATPWVGATTGRRAPRGPGATSSTGSTTSPLASTPPRSGDAAFTQAFEGGTNVVALIPGDELPDEYVIVGAHYDHLGTRL